jgi:hypothetical protein
MTQARQNTMTLAHQTYNAERYPFAVASNCRGMIRMSATSDLCAAVPIPGHGYLPHSFGTIRDVQRIIAEGHLLPAYHTDNHSPEFYE